MKLKSKLTSVLLGSVILAGSAQAAIQDGTAPGQNNAGGSELIFAAFDGNNTYVRDLGISFGGIDDTSSFNFAADGDLLGLIGGGSVQWTVLASDNNLGGSGTDASNYGSRLLATSASGSSVFNQGLATNRVSSLTQAANNTDSFTTTANFQPGHAGTVADNGASVDGASAWNNLITLAGGVGGSASVTGVLGSSLEFLLYGHTGDVTSSPFGSSYSPTDVFANLLGTWSLGVDGLLTYNGANASVVPVPAAVWLFGSALLGLVGVGRRKQQLAV